jgi:hypothetical protein
MERSGLERNLFVADRPQTSRARRDKSQENLASAYDTRLGCDRRCPFHHEVNAARKRLYEEPEPVRRASEARHPFEPPRVAPSRARKDARSNCPGRQQDGAHGITEGRGVFSSARYSRFAHAPSDLAAGRLAAASRKIEVARHQHSLLRELQVHAQSKE